MCSNSYNNLGPKFSKVHIQLYWINIHILHNKQKCTKYLSLVGFVPDKTLLDYPSSELWFFSTQPSTNITERFKISEINSLCQGFSN